MAAERKRRFHVPDSWKAALLRWWIVGMCYFMIGFGTQAGGRSDPLDLIFFLGVGIGLATIVVYNPIAYSAFDIVWAGEIVNQARKKRRGAAKALDNLAEIGVSFCVVILVYLTYQNVNLLLVELLERPEGTVLVPGEPFGFATLYLLFYCALTGLIGRVWAARRAARAKARAEETDGGGTGQGGG